MDNIHGLSPNMLQIAQIESARRESGAKSYGYYEHEHHVKGIDVEPSHSGMKQCTCGKWFVPYGMENKCINCQIKSMVEKENKKKKPEKDKSGMYTVKCCRCGELVKRTRPMKNAVCKACTSKKRYETAVEHYRAHKKTMQKERAEYTLKCIDCGCDIIRKGKYNNAICKDCQRKRRNEYGKEYHRKRRVADCEKI